MVNNVASRSWRHEPWRHEPRELIPGPLLRYMYSREPVTIDQGSVAGLKVNHPTRCRLLIPDPTTLQGEAINLHNAGSGISAAKSNPRNISGRSCFDSRIKVCCIF